MKIHAYYFIRHVHFTRTNWSVTVGLKPRLLRQWLAMGAACWRPGAGRAAALPCISTRLNTKP